MDPLNRQHCRGLSLVEILIVVVILAVLAAIVIPQFSDAAETARATSVQSQLRLLRGQLLLYQTQHNGEFPTLAQLWTNLIEPTDIAGATSGVADYGPYLVRKPVNPFEDASVVFDTPAPGVGWVYDQNTGTLKACIAHGKALSAGLDLVNDVATYGAGGI